MLRKGPSATPCTSVGLAIALTLQILAAANSAFSQSETILHSFQGAPSDGAIPLDNLVADTAGNLYGTTQYGGNGTCNATGILGCGTVFALAPPAQKGGAWTETILHHFQGGNGSDGASPAAGLVFDRAGNLYGTTSSGGAGFGTVFELSPPAVAGAAWTENILYSFQGTPTDGSDPTANLIFDKSGNLYGTTARGGNGLYLDDCGTAFELSPPTISGGSWTETILHSFQGDQKLVTDGCYPAAGVVINHGSLYGVTSYGGLGNNGGTSLGTAFRLERSPRGAFETFYSFNQGTFAVGAGPSGLIADSSGNLYGAAEFAGDQSCDHGKDSCGIIFQLTPPSQSGGTWTENTLYNFQQSTGSYLPLGSLIFDAKGNLYGVTLYSVYKLSPPATNGSPWTETILYKFQGGTDGLYPAAGVISSHGGLFGTTSNGGTGVCPNPYIGCGTVYRVSP